MMVQCTNAWKGSVVCLATLALILTVDNDGVGWNEVR